MHLNWSWIWRSLCYLVSPGWGATKQIPLNFVAQRHSLCSHELRLPVSILWGIASYIFLIACPVEKLRNKVRLIHLNSFLSRCNNFYLYWSSLELYLCFNAPELGLGSGQWAVSCECLSCGSAELSRGPWGAGHWWEPMTLLTALHGVFTSRTESSFHRCDENPFFHCSSDCFTHGIIKGFLDKGP